MLRAEIVRRGQRIHKLTTASGITPERAELQAAELMVCQADFWHWMRNWCWFFDPKSADPALRTIPALLWPDQERLIGFYLDGIAQGRQRVVLKSRAIGATWLACAVLYWCAAVSKDRSGFSALFMSRVEELVDSRKPDSLFGKLRFIHSMLPSKMPGFRPEVARDAYMVIDFTGGGSFAGVSTNRHAGRSGRYAVVVSDEWAAVERPKQEAIKLALESVARSWWRISTPEGKGDDFADTVEVCRKHRPQDLIEIGWQADPRRTQEWYDKLLLENGGSLTWDQRERSYNMSFAAVSGLRVFRADRAKITYSDAWLEATYPLARRTWVKAFPMDFGSGPSWTVCGFVLVSWDHGKDVGEGASKRRLPLLLVDRELVWQSVNAGDIGRQIMATRAAHYPGLGWHFGDPTGRSRDSSQESWESNLRAVGVPLSCLPGQYNTEALRTQSITEGQMMMEAGLLKFHGGGDGEPARCPYTLESIESWEWDVPSGVSIKMMNRAELKPKKNGYSHLADACILYLVSAILRTGRATYGLNAAEAEDAATPAHPGAVAQDIQHRIAQASKSGRVDEDDVEDQPAYQNPFDMVGIGY